MHNYHYLNINKTVYAYKRVGRGEPVLLLHGFTGTSATWNPLTVSLAKSKEVITIDLPGHGKTTGDAAKTAESISADLAAIIDSLQLENVHLIGYSMGGRIALSFSLLYPQYVRTLTLESASPGIEDAEERAGRRLADEALAAEIIAKGIEHFVRKWENIPLFATQKLLPETRKRAIRAERVSQSPDGLANSLIFAGTGKQPSWWGEIPKIKCPVLLIVGKNDKKFVKLNEKMVKLIKEAKLVCVDHAGHAVHIEQPQVFGHILSEFYKN